ncbi:galactose mutarotase-like enzyme [Bacillus oleivorans]|uniref:Galactose mutarotase-like enzyme n=1 Tax=Bacillus oleivorans TaxID=1448271 RepID=A0A285CHW2_9BACI|nr:aldose epimerase [Bacillus oleivorans]SNX67184.1 galactose mutarotase-like enzyme [Bacillus oleivorans]
MYKINQSQLGDYTVYELNDQEVSSLKVIPERGGIIVGFQVDGEDILYLNEETLLNPEANVRGGIPILFPICGALENGEYTYKGKTYQMKNHGFARNMAWEVVGENTEGRASITLKLSSNEVTKKVYPFDFDVLFTYQLKGRELIILQEYVNRSDEPMPMYAGFHPYFKTSKKSIVYDLEATQYLDYNDMEVKPYQELDLSTEKEAFLILDPKGNELSFPLEEIQKKVTMKYGEEFNYIVLWSEIGKDFLCVEPWMGKMGDFKTMENIPLVEPGESLVTVVSISVD